MALKEYKHEPAKYLTIVKSKEKQLQDQVEETQKRTYHIYNEAENDYNICLSPEGYNCIMNSVKNPKCNEKLAKALNENLNMGLIFN